MQELIVAIIVACSAFAVARRYLPASVRNAARRLAANAALQLGWQDLAGKLAVQGPVATSCADGCGPCNGCGTVSAAGPASFGISPDALKRTARK